MRDFLTAAKNLLPEVSNITAGKEDIKKLVEKHRWCKPEDSVVYTFYFFEATKKMAQKANKEMGA